MKQKGKDDMLTFLFVFLAFILKPYITVKVSLI